MRDFDEFRQRADAVRQIPLEAVLAFRGAVRDRQDRAKWHTERGPLSVTGAKFTAWQASHGGGGAIDLVMHLAQVDVGPAVQWLERHLAAGALPVAQSTPSSSGRPRPVPQGRGPLQLPLPEERQLARVRQYLKERRGLAGSVLEGLIQSGKLYGDRRGNAVFLLMTGNPNRPVGAELRGTGPRVWRGMASGTRKNLGFFWLGAPASRQLVLCESAIDAISFYQMHPEWLCVSTSGVRANPAWLPALITRGYEIHCGFDADDPGDAAADRMITLHPTVRRLRPSAHDWNDVLTYHVERFARFFDKSLDQLGPEESRAHARTMVFENEADYTAFEQLFEEAVERTQTRRRGRTNGRPASPPERGSPAWTSVRRFLEPAGYEFKNPREWARVTSLTTFQGKLFASLGSCRVAGRRRGVVPVYGLADADSHAPVARAPTQRGKWQRLPGPVQVLPGAGGPAFLHAVSLREASATINRPRQLAWRRKLTPRCGRTTRRGGNDELQLWLAICRLGVPGRRAGNAGQRAGGGAGREAG